MTGPSKVLRPSIKHLKQVIASSDYIDVSPIDLFNKAAVESHLREVKRLLTQVNARDIEKVAKALGPYKKGSVYYLAGNGGSAANASHFAAHLWEHGINARCLTDNVPLLTAKANDVSYVSALRCMVKDAYAPEGLVIFSCSGNSANVLKVAKCVHGWGLPVIGFLGNNGGRAKQYCSLSLVLDSKNAAAVEDAHSAAMHAVAAAL